MTYSVEFRIQALNMKERLNLTYREAASRLGIGSASLTRWNRELEPQKHRNRPATKINTDILLKDVEMYPDAYHQERADRLQVSSSGIGAALKRLGISRKKTFSHPKADEQARSLFKERMEYYKKSGRTIAYLDESGFANDMPRSYGYAPIGEKCLDKRNWHEKGRQNAIGAIVDFCLVTVTLFVGSINSDIFLLWLTKDLLPKLSNGCVIVMDNASFHKRRDIQQIIKAHGHILEYLPPYSPDLNPIENYWSKAKAIRRRTHCTVETLFAHEL